MKALTFPLAPASKLKKKKLSGKYFLFCICPNGHADLLNTTHFHIENGANSHKSANSATKLKRNGWK